VKPLTDAQRRALHLAAKKGGSELGNAKGQIRQQTANLLMLRQWVTISSGTALITKAGRAELQKPLPPPPAVFLRRRDGLTTRMDQRVAEEPELMRDQLRPDWLEHSAALHLASRRDVDALRLSGLPHPEERLAELRRMALERGIDVSSDVGAIQRRLDAMERKVTRVAA
jgi:hypothetical protein